MSGWSVGMVVTGTDVRFAINLPDEPMTAEDTRDLAAYLLTLCGAADSQEQEIVR